MVSSPKKAILIKSFEILFLLQTMLLSVLSKYWQTTHDFSHILQLILLRPDLRSAQKPCVKADDQEVESEHPSENLHMVLDRNQILLL